MGERTSYEPGTFCWVDLATTEPGEAEAFYSGLFGWEAEDISGEFGTYTMLRLRGLDACGLYAMPEEARAAGSRPYWTSYVAVGDTEAAAERADSLGATILAVFDVASSGRIAILRDPQGATFGTWESEDHAGAGIVNEPGGFSLNQLNTTDPPSAGRFYADLFGWEIAQVATEPVSYWGINNRGRLNGGMMALPLGDPGPPHWLVYFTTADLNASVDAVAGSGGAILVPPMPVPGGRIAVARDAQGGHFALFEGRVDP
jgi:predicted enzyme related to lactoylglutathione lyase